MVLGSGGSSIINMLQKLRVLTEALPIQVSLLAKQRWLAVGERRTEA